MKKAKPEAKKPAVNHGAALSIEAQNIAEHQPTRFVNMSLVSRQEGNVRIVVMENHHMTYLPAGCVVMTDATARALAETILQVLNTKKRGKHG